MAYTSQELECIFKKIYYIKLKIILHFFFFIYCITSSNSEISKLALTCTPRRLHIDI